MIRNYALTFSGGMLRLWLAIFDFGEVEFIEAYVLAAWLSWVPNLIVAEWMVSRIRAEDYLGSLSSPLRMRSSPNSKS